MKKRIVALLLCACMLTGVFSGGIVIPANAEVTGTFTDTLTVDQEGKALCPVCNKTVTWNAFAGNAAGTQKMGEFSDGEHHHYYLSADVNAKNIDVYFLQLTASTKMCFHLNGHDLYHGGYIMAGGGAVLNILGSGNVIFTATNTSPPGYYDQSGLYANVGSSLTLYGGNYSVAEEALETGKPTLQVRDVGAGKAFIKNAVVQGKAYVAGGTLTLEEGAQVEQIQVDAPGKLYVKSNWTGNAAVSFATALQNNTVPAANGGCEGAFTGKLQINYGAELTGTADGTLTATGINADLQLDADSKAQCPVCKTTVTWSAYNNERTINDGAHHHIYLDKDIDARNVAWQFLNVLGDSDICLHLNGHDLYYGGYIMAGGGTILNIMGRGNTVFTATNTSDECDISGLYVNTGGTINLYGGTHSVAEDAAAEGIPVLCIRDVSTTSSATVKNAVVQGRVEIPNSVFTLEETAKVENIQIGAAGKLYVKSNWTGSAKVTFAAALEDHVVPAASGGAEGQFAGKLTLPNGNKLQANASGRLVETGVNACLVPDANSKALCEACHKVVTWTAFAGNDAGTANLGHRNTAGAHYHYYLSADANAKNIKEYFMNLMTGSFCLHLNGHDLYHGGYVLVATGAVLNVMGSGNMVFTATNNGGFDQAGLFMRGIITLYGGTYDVALDALEEGIPTIVQDGGSARILDGVSVKGLTEIRKGSVTLEDSAKLENVQVDTTLTLKDSATVTGNVGLRTASATVQGPEGLNVTTTAGDTVLYSAGKYAVHNHAFTQETVKDTALKSAATCTSAALYYTSCTCGEIGTEATFSSGEELGHDYKVTYTNDGETHTKVETCANDAAHKVETSNLAHVYDQEDNTKCVCGAAKPQAEETNQAQINGQKYETLQAALTAAAQSETPVVIDLLKDTEVGMTTVADGVTLNLNGKTLTVAEGAYVIACFETSFITDTEGTGRVVVDIDHLLLLQNNSQLPVQTETGIMFVDAALKGNWSTKDDCFKFWFDEETTDAALIEQLKKGSKASELKIQVELSYNNGLNKMSYVYDDAVLAQYLAKWDQNACLTIAVQNVGSISDLTFTAKVVFADGTEAEVNVLGAAVEYGASAVS